MQCTSNDLQGEVKWLKLKIHEKNKIIKRLLEDNAAQTSTKEQESKLSKQWRDCISDCTDLCDSVIAKSAGNTNKLKRQSAVVSLEMESASQMFT